MLQESLKTALADSFAFSLKAQFYHWNVEGADFKQYHDLFGTIYEEVSDSVDIIAELIRSIDMYAPGTLMRMKQLSTVTEDDTIPSAMLMVRNLETENKKVLVTLMRAYKDAEELGELGVSNYLQDRIQAHTKHGWMLRATLK